MGCHHMISHFFHDEFFLFIPIAFLYKTPLRKTQIMHMQENRNQENES